jgi:glycosyltransferase involved in cell wall biosynthesis
MSTPQIGIVVPAYNAEKYLACTLDSVLNQTVRDWVLVLVDDGSVDRTATIAKSYAARDPRIQVVQQPNRGVSSARNTGYAELDAGCELVIFLDGDDVWEPNALETLQQALESHPECVAAHGLTYTIDAEGRRLQPDVAGEWHSIRRGIVDGRVVSWPTDAPTTFEVLVVECRIRTAGSVLIRRRALDQLELFDSSLRGNEDWDVWLRLSRCGPMTFVSTPVLGYRRHQTNASGDFGLMGRTHRLVRLKTLAAVDLTDDQRSLVRLGIRLSLRDCVGLWWRLARHDASQGRIGSLARCLYRLLRDAANLGFLVAAEAIQWARPDGVAGRPETISW